MKKDRLYALLEYLRAVGVNKNDKLKMKKKYGAGILDFINIKSEFNNESMRTLEEYGKYEIQELIISKTKIFGAMKKIVKSITGFDSIYHLALIARINTPNGDKYISMQKRQQVQITDHFETVKGETVTRNVLINKKITIDQLINNCLQKIGKDMFHLYDAISKNCQKCVYDLLKSSNLGNQSDYDFFMQDVSQLQNTAINKGLNLLTDTGTRVAQLMGKGNEKCCDKCGSMIKPYVKLNRATGGALYSLDELNH